MSSDAAKEEARLAKALNRVRAPSRSSSSPLIRTPEKPAVKTTPAPEVPEKKPALPSFLELRKAPRQEQPRVVESKNETKSTLVPGRVATVAPVRQAEPTRRHAVVLHDPVLSDAELELRCIQWLERVRPFLENEPAMEVGFEVGEEMERKSPRYVK